MTHTTTQPTRHTSSEPRGGIHTMTTITDHTPSAGAAPDTSFSGRPITQYSRRRIFTIWAAAAIPMAVLSWIVAPAIADGSGAESLVKPLLACMAAGLVWQFAIVAVLVG